MNNFVEGSSASSMTSVAEVNGVQRGGRSNLSPLGSPQLGTPLRWGCCSALLFQPEKMHHKAATIERQTKGIIIMKLMEREKKIKLKGTK